jgi:hypothetical protein
MTRLFFKTALDESGAGGGGHGVGEDSERVAAEVASD